MIAAQAAVFVIPIACFVVAAWQHRLVAEDGFIYLRVAKQVVAGNGPVFNPGQRVEATTGVLWVYLLALGDLITPLRLEWVAVVLGIGLSAAGVVCTLLGSRRLWPTPTQGLFVPFGAIAFVALMPAWVFASTGLETGLSFAWLGASLWALAAWARTPEGRLATWQAALLGLGWLVRPELVLFSGGFLVVVLAMTPPRGPRERIRIAVAFLAIPVLYQLFRMGYYGSLVPNTAIAKDGGSAIFERGWRYFADFTGPYWLWVPALALLLGGYTPLVRAARGQNRVRAVAAVFLVGGLLDAGYIVWVGGDHTHARLLLPAFFAVCAPVAAIPWTRAHLPALIMVPWALVAVLALRPDQYDTKVPLAHGVAMVPTSMFGDVTIDDWGWGTNGPLRQWYTGPAYYRAGNLVRPGVRTDLPLAPGTKLPLGAFYGVGVSGYAMGTDFRILDLEGLADPFTAHLISTLPPMTTFPGHTKPLPAPWLAARVTRAGARPDPQDFPGFGSPLIPATTGRRFQEQVLWARAALRCPAIRRLSTASDAALTPRRFASNLWRSASNSRVRIPPEPETAYHRFCGPGMPASVRELRSER